VGHTLAEGVIMLKKMDESAGNVIGIQVMGVLEKADFAILIEEVQNAIDEVGSQKKPRPGRLISNLPANTKEK
jgi:hypothetical protein